LNQLADTQAEGAPRAERASNAKLGSAAKPPAAPLGRERLIALVVLGLGVAALAIPTFIQNFQQYWSLDEGAQVPITLAIGTWLLVRRWPAMKAAAATRNEGAPSTRTVSNGIAVGLWLAMSLVYVLGRVAGQYLVETYALYGFLLIGIYAMFGARGLITGGFPLAYLVFALPIPFFISHALTTHLRLALTDAIVNLFQLCGFTIVKDGLTILVDQYQLSIEDACSGMNSLFSLSAIGLVYVYLRRPGQTLYYMLMLAPIVGFAIFSNFVRIAIVVLLTHTFGDAVAQSLLHEATGFITFSVALGGVIALDALVGPWLARRRSNAKYDSKPGRPAISTVIQ
jgi:exosortase